MKIHVYRDGSEDYEYEVGDRVIVEKTIVGGWFDYGPTRSERCIVERREERAHRTIREIQVRYSDDWGPARCLPWMLRPHPETMATAQRIPADAA